MNEQLPVPIAIIGMSCRFPGGANDPDKLWEMVSNGRTSWTDVPEDRWRWKSFYNPHPEANGAHNARGGCFLDSDISEFDAGFFGIPPAEATAMDPQHRFQIESAFEALESAGIPVETLKGTDTAVFTAIASRDYDRMAYKDTSDIAKYHLTGCGDPTLCGRISYLFDLKGPSVTLDTGCSGSLVCLHQACTSLRTGEPNMAIVGGTHLLLGPDLTIAMSLLHMINDDGRCYSFDSRGAGYGRAEGVATVILKRLDDAIRDGDPIRAVIRNTGTNSDGKTNGILLPSSAAQQRLMQSTIKAAGINPLDVGYVEAHGTGTQAGDAAETGSISRTFSDDGKRDSSLFVGSIKANIGHLEATSGLAGLIKTVLMLEKGLVAPVPNIVEMKEGLSLGSHIKIPRVLEAFPGPRPGSTENVRLAAISSFGFGGSNASAVLAASATTVEVDVKRILLNGANSDKVTHRHANGIYKNGSIEDDGNRPELIAISAKSEKSLRSILTNLRIWLAKNQENKENTTTISDLAYTLAVRRSKMQWRWTAIASNFQTLTTPLDVSNSPRIVRVAPEVRVVFLFTGQGAQWFAMGRELIGAYPTFRRSLERSARALSRLGASWDLLGELMRDETTSQINKSEFSQPISTAVQIALVDLLTELSVVPQAVLGHSSGEIAAAYAARFLDHETALAISYHRSFISSWCKEDVRGEGAMIAVGLGEADVSLYLNRVQNGTAVVACSNSPASTTVSGDETAIDELKDLLDFDSVFNRRLQVDTAYHSHHMQMVAGRYMDAMSEIHNAVASQQSNGSASGTRFFSSVTGHEKFSDFGAAYWIQNLVSKVQYNGALEQLINNVGAQSIGAPPYVFTEIGPHGALSGPTRQTLSHVEIGALKYTYASCLTRGRDGRNTIMELASSLFIQGYPIELPKLLNETRKYQVIKNLAPYAWDHSNQYWHESRLSKDYRMRNHAPHELLGLKVVGTSYLEPTWRNDLSASSLPWIQEHIIDGFALFPGGAFLCMAMEAIHQMIVDRQIPGTINKYLMKDVIYSKALVVPDAPAKIEIQLTLRPSKGLTDKNATAWEDFRITSYGSDCSWNEHCRGSITVEFDPVCEEDNEAVKEEKLTALAGMELISRLKSQCSEGVEPQDFYDSLRLNGIDYGPNFSILTDMTVGPCKALGTIIIPDVSACMPSGYQQAHIIHPATFDAMMHIVLPLYSRHCSKGPVMLISVDEVVVSTKISSQPGDKLLVGCELSPAGSRSGMVEWSVFQKAEDSQYIPVVNLRCGEFRGIGEGQMAGPDLGLEDTPPLNLHWDSDVDLLPPNHFQETRTSTEKSSHLSELYIAKYLAKLAFKRPQLKIIDIGARASDSTLAILEALKLDLDSTDRTQLLESYEYTDHSLGVFEKAPTLLNEWQHILNHKTFDISRDAASQNLVENSYDVVIAGNATMEKHQIRQIFENVRKLLRTGGQMIVIPNTGAAPLSLLSVDEWNEHLLATSFEGMNLTINGYGGLADTEPVIIMSEAIALDRSSITLSHPVEIISRSSSTELEKFGDELHSYMLQRGLDASHKSWSSSFQPSDCLRVILDDATDPYLDEHAVSRSQDVSTLMKASSNILWVSYSAHLKILPKTSTTMLARMARKNNNDIKFVTFDIQDHFDDDLPTIIRVMNDISHEFTKQHHSTNPTESIYVYQHGRVLIPRFMPDFRFCQWIYDSTQNADFVTDRFRSSNRRVRLHVETPGLLDSLIFVDENDSPKPLDPSEVEIEAHAFGINQKDVSIALGRSRPLAKMVGEFSGVVTAVGSDAGQHFEINDKVCGFGGAPYGNHVRVNSNLLHKLPNTVNFTEGASIPYAFATAWTALVEVGQLEANQQVLIHSAAGAIGQAALIIAKHIGAEIFATVGSSVKRQLLIDKFNILDSHIFSSHSATFKTGIKRLTYGRGVDVVLNSLSGDSLFDTWSCVADFGTFVEIGKLGKSQISTEPFDRNVTFASVDISLMAKHQPQKVKKILAKVMNLFETGQLRAVSPIQALPISDLVPAFRLIQGRKHIGKIVVTADHDAIVKMSPPKQDGLKLDADATYLVRGGTIGLAIAIADFLVLKGAKTVVIMTSEADGAKDELPSELEDLVHIKGCDLANHDHSQAAFRWCFDSFSTVRGVIDCGTVDHSIQAYGPQFQQATNTSDILFRNIGDRALEFFVFLRWENIHSALHDDAIDISTSTNSVASVRENLDRHPNFMFLSLGAIEGMGPNEPSPQEDPKGSTPIRFEAFLKVLEYSMSNRNHAGRKHDVVMGFNRQSLLDQQNLSELRDPLFAHLPYPTKNGIQVSDGKATTSVTIEQSILASQSDEETHAIIADATRVKIAQLVALDYDEIGLDMPLEGFGLDSLVAIEFKNWIGRNISASMQTSEILDTPNIHTLSKLVMERSILVSGRDQVVAAPEINGEQLEEAQKSTTKPTSSQTLNGVQVSGTNALPELPLPDLKTTLKLWLESIRPFCAPKDIERVSQKMADFQKTGGVGPQIQRCLLERHNDSTGDNWLSEIYNKEIWLSNRSPLVPFSSYFFSHQLSSFQHQQAERAAIIAKASYEYMQKLNDGDLPPVYLNEQLLCAESNKWLFNTSRKPCFERDEMQSFPDDDYVVILSRGRAFKMQLQIGVSLKELQSIFQDILDTTQDSDVSWLGILTSDERNSWARIRESIISDSVSNKEYIHFIEASAFVICLDEAAPSNPIERARHFHFGDGSNRWNDKSIQFVICSNGVSAIIGDHTMLDASTANGLNDFVIDAILQHPKDTTAPFYSPLTAPQEYTLTPTPTLIKHITNLKQTFSTTTASYEHAFFTLPKLGSHHLRAHRLPPASALQILVQLALSRYFAQLTPCWETVSLGTFRRGRVDIVQTVSPPVATWIASLAKPEISRKQKGRLFAEACRAHAAGIGRAFRGKSYARHLLALRCFAEETGVRGGLLDDEISERMRPKKAFSNCHSSRSAEKGCVLEDREGVWMHFEVEDEFTRFSVTSGVGNTARFQKVLVEAVGDVMGILEGVDRDGEDAHSQ